MGNNSNALLKKKLPALFINCVLFSISVSIGQMLDSMCAGKFIGMDAMATISIGSTIVSFLQAPGSILGRGGSVLAGIFIGQTKKDKANQVFSLTMLLGVIFSVLFIFLSLFSKSIATLLAGEALVSRDLILYIRYSLLGAPIYCIALQLNTYVSVDNHLKLRSIYTFLSVGIKIAFLFLFLKVQGKGVEYVVLSTYLGRGLALLVYVFYFTSKSRMLHFSNPFNEIKNINTQLRDFIRPYLISFVGIALSHMLLRMFLARKGGTTILVLISLFDMVETCLVAIIVSGASYLMNNITGILFGEKNYSFLKYEVKVTLLITVSLLLIFGSLICFFPLSFIDLFGLTENNIGSISITTVRCACLYCLFISLLSYANMYYSNVGMNKISSLLSFLKEYVFSFPLIIGLCSLCLLKGIDIIYGYLLGMILSPLLPEIIVYLYIRLKLKHKDLWEIPEVNKESVLEYSVTNLEEQFEDLADLIEDFCKANHIKRSDKLRIMLLTEEVLISLNKTKKLPQIDVCIRLDRKDSIKIILHSDGKPIDSIENLEKDFTHLIILKKLIYKAHFLRSLELNDTVLKIKLDTIKE